MTAWLTTLGRLLLGAVFAAASLTKITDPQGSVRAVRAYQLVPEAMVRPFAYALPYVELAVAVLLLLGLALRYAAGAAALMLVLFMAAVASAAFRGLRIDCGCFGGGGATDNPQYAVELLRDGALLAVASVVAFVGRTHLSLDNALELSP